MIKFETLRRSPRPNNFLVADKETCPRARADMTPPVFQNTPEEVLAAWQTVIAAEPRTKETAADAETMTYQYVQRSKLMGFPDTITVRFLPEGEGTKLLVYSASRFGYSDLGVNAKRVKSWLAAVERELGSA